MIDIAASAYNSVILGDQTEEEDPKEVLGPLPAPKAKAHVGFVETQFFEHLPLGLKLNWDMPFPVVAQVLPGSIASTRSELYEGLVLIAINKSGVRIRPLRDEIEEKLRERPLHLVFEAPAPERFDFFHSMKAWSVHVNKERAKLPSTKKQGMSMTMQSFFGQSNRSNFGLSFKEGTMLPLPPPSSKLAKSMNRVQSHPGVFGSLDGSKLPPVIRGSDMQIQKSDMRRVQNLERTLPTGMTWGGATSTTADPFKQAMSTSGLAWMGSGFSKPDTAYQHLLDEPREVGPGLPERWALHHDSRYTCQLSDMLLAWKLRDAYEVGFRGFKHERTSQMHLTCAKGAPPLRRKIERVDEVYCDLCGTEVWVDKDEPEGPTRDALEELLYGAGPKKVTKKAEADDEPKTPLVGVVKETAGAFYFCRRCKRSGNRYELCAACHAIEVIQSEGKHYGKELHPHFLRCQHRSLVRRRLVNDALPGMVHIRRVMCDYCGNLAGSYDSDSEIWVCPQCPEKHGMRFEMCMGCYNTLMTVSHGVGRLRLQ